VAEAVTNALKHAKGNSATGSAILVRCRKGALGGLRVEVVDDGPGLPESFNPETDGGLGFRLLRALTRQVGGVMTFKSSPTGLRVRLALPSSRQTSGRGPVRGPRPSRRQQRVEGKAHCPHQRS
jgi:two-component sensor histidine kinase